MCVRKTDSECESVCVSVGGGVGGGAMEVRLERVEEKQIRKRC